MKNILSAVLLTALFTGPLMAQNTKVYIEQGGAKQVIKSGGEIEVRSGGLIDMQAGSTLTINQAAQLNISASPTFTDLSVTYGVGAATGVFSGALSAASVAAPAHTGATLALTGAADINGAVTMGADNTVSTMAANGALTVHASVTAPAITGSTSVTSPLYIGTGAIRLYSRTKAQINALATPAIGDAYYCSDCTAVTMCVSTGTVVNSFVKVDARTAVCD
jgi:hypothetical protein